MDDMAKPDQNSGGDPSVCTCELCGCRKRDKLNIASRSLQKLPSCVLTLRNLTWVNLNYNNLKSLPENFCKEFSANLETLSLKGNDLRLLPETLGAMQNLKTLDVSENMISKLPECFTDLCHLQSLKCVANVMKQLPNDIEKLVALEVLHLDENRLKTLPDSFGALAALHTLEISNNRLTELPSNIGGLQQLTCLNVSYNSINCLPESLSLLELLEDVDLSNNSLKTLPDAFASARRLRKLFGDCNLFCTLPSWINDMPCIEELSFENNQLVKSPFKAEFGTRCCRLRHFNFAGNFMEHLPDSIGELAIVEFVHLGSTLHELERRNFQNGNWLTLLPENFGHMRALKHLRLDENQLRSLPESFGELSSLESLDLGQNKLTTLPENFGNLRSLKTCQLSKNFLERLPDSFGTLVSLVELRLDNNMLKELPDSFRELVQLKTLDLFNNELTEVPQCLQFMKKVTYLELDENNFGVALEEVPHIIYRTQYPDRNPKLAKNWRGKSRQDQYDHDADQSDNSIPTENLEQMNKVLAALKQGSALWKSHAETGTREKFDHDAAKTRDISFRQNVVEDVSHQLSDFDLNCSLESRESRSEDDDTNCSSTATTNVEAEIDEYVPEDWDKEIEESDPFSVYDDFPVKRYKTAIPVPYGFPVKNGFLPANDHPTSILRYPVQVDRSFSGQFDDAE